MEYPPPNPDKIEHFDHLVSIARLEFPKIMRKFAEEKNPNQGNRHNNCDRKRT
jgi:hypothetical protein